jgi:hypothetical protein
MLFLRLRDPAEVGPGFGQVIEAGGVLTLGQEPDIPWGDFDPFQATNGVFDELHIWSVTRTHEQIRANYRKYIDVENDPDAANLNLYYTFDDLQDSSAGAATTTDISPLGSNQGLVGALPTIKNQFTFANGELPRTPTRPDWVTTSACHWSA